MYPLRFLATTAVGIAALLPLGAVEDFGRIPERRAYPILVSHGVATLDVVLSSFRYATPLKYEELVAQHAKEPLETCPPEVVLAREQMALTTGDLTALLATVEEGGARDQYRRMYADHLADVSQERAHVSLVLENGFQIGDDVGITFSMSSEAAGSFSWYEILRNGPKGWRIITDIPIGGFIATLLSAAQEGDKRFPAPVSYDGLTDFSISSDGVAQPLDPSLAMQGTGIVLGIAAQSITPLDFTQDDPDQRIHLLHQIFSDYHGGVLAKTMDAYWLVRAGVDVSKTPFGWRGEHAQHTLYGWMADDDFAVALIGDSLQWRSSCVELPERKLLVGDGGLPPRNNTVRLFIECKSMGPILRAALSPSLPHDR